MAYDKTLPANSTKIRNYPTVLTDNFAAIEEGDISLKHWQVNFIERNAVPGGPPPANDPTRNDDTMIVYSKQDSTGNTELFLMDDRNPANIMQLSTNGAIGNTSTPMNCSTIAFSTASPGGLNYGDGQMAVAYGVFNSAGTLLYGKNMAEGSPKTAGTGVYNVRVNADVLLNANYLVIGSVNRVSGTSAATTVQPITQPTPVASTVTQIQVSVAKNDGRTSTFTNFQVVIFGGR